MALYFTRVAKLLDTRAEFITAGPLEGQLQCDLGNHNLCKNSLLKFIVVQ